MNFTRYHSIATYDMVQDSLGLTFSYMIGWKPGKLKATVNPGTLPGCHLVTCVGSTQVCIWQRGQSYICCVPTNDRYLHPRGKNICFQMNFPLQAYLHRTRTVQDPTGPNCYISILRCFCLALVSLGAFNCVAITVHSGPFWTHLKEFWAYFETLWPDFDHFT